MAERSARATAAGERILEMLETEPAVRDKPGAMRAPKFSGSISFEHVTFRYAKNIPALIDVHFEIKPGERVAIVGPTGAGKSTLASLIPRFYDPTHGRVCIDGYDICDLMLDSLRNQISLVFQEPVLFAASIFENIAYGKAAATNEEVIQAASRAGIDRIIQSLPEGYKTVIGERGATLSGGQRQCVAIARAIIRDAPIVILDEPTTGLDSYSSSLVLQALDRLMEGRTVLMISHQLRSVQEADHILVIGSGTVVQEGTHVELFARPGLYRSLVLESGEFLL